MEPNIPHLLQELQKLEIAKGLKDQVEVLLLNYDHYVKVKQSAVWQSLLVTVANAYPPDEANAVVFLVNEGRIKGEPVENKNRTAVKFVDMGGSSGKVGTGGCTNCPDGEKMAVANAGGIGSGDNDLLLLSESSGDGEKKLVPVINDLSEATTAEQVLNYFTRGVEPTQAIGDMQAYLKIANVNLYPQKRNDPEYLSEKIFDHMDLVSSEDNKEE